MSPPPHSAPYAPANFDLGVLFYNRARQTADCILSFLDETIRPNVVVLDQGSAVDQRKFLDDALRPHANVRIVTLPENTGPAAGRNRLCRECRAEWILFVDNDVTLNTRGGVALIHSAVEGGGNIDGFSPRILNIHDNRILERLRVIEERGRLKIALVDAHAATSNMFAGCAVVLRRSVLRDRPYDERHGVSFEDFDLALRAFADGRPLSLKCLNDVTLVHRHMPAVSEPDVESVRTRYKIPQIAKDFAVLKTKRGGELFDNWEPWVVKQQKEMLPSRRIAARRRDAKSNITFVVDVPNWVSEEIVRNLNLHMGVDHALTVLRARENDDSARVLRQILDSRAHIIHFMRRGDFARLVSEDAVKKCAALTLLTEAEIVNRLCQSHMTFSVGDDLFLKEKDIGSFRPLFWLSDGYCVVSPALFDVYNGISDYPKPAALIPHGVDKTFYRPSAQARHDSAIKVGWIGSMRTNADRCFGEADGLKTIVRPAIERLRAEDVDVELAILDHDAHENDPKEMAAFYREIDIVVCTSSTEHASNSVLGAMASGVPIVAARAGIAPGIFGPQQQCFTVERSAAALADALRKLCVDTGLRQSLSQENLQRIGCQTWESRAILWQRFFTDVVRQAHPDAPNWKRLMIEKFFLLRTSLRSP